MFKANTANPNAVLPSQNVATVGNAFERGLDRQESRNRMANQEERLKERDSTSKRNDAIEAMASDPVNAERIAQVHGIKYDDNMRALFANKELAKLTVDGSKMARAMGIGDSSAAREFIKAYVSSRGDMATANGAIEGMNLEGGGNPKEYMMRVGDSVIDVRTGNPIYSENKPSPPKTTGLPSGYAWDPEEMTPVAIPNYPFDPFDDPTLPDDLRIEGQVLQAEMKGGMVDQQRAQEYMGKIKDFRRQSQQGTPILPEMPQAGQTPPFVPPQEGGFSHLWN
jgi:hypothetical protein